MCVFERCKVQYAHLFMGGNNPILKNGLFYSRKK